MDIKSRTKQLARHGRALDVPTGAPQPKRGLPFGLLWLLDFAAFPEHKIQWAFFATQDGNPLTRVQLVQGFTGKVTIRCKASNRKIHIVPGLVGQAFVHQDANHVHHLGHMLGGTGLSLGGSDIEFGCILV